MKNLLDHRGNPINEFAYRAGKDSPNRPYVSTQFFTGDNEFVNTNQRQKIYNSANDLNKNFSIVQFAVQSHLDYITNYKFSAKTKNREFNTYIEKFLKEKTSKFNVDTYRRFNINQLARLFYSQKLVFGDTFCLKAFGGKLQLIDPQLITAQCNNVPSEVSQHGVVVNKYGAIDKYCLSIVDDSFTRVFQRLIDYKYMIADGYFPNPTATRGVSPLVTVINTAIDKMNLDEYTLLKAKIQSIFGLAIFRQAAKSGTHDFDYNVDTNSPANQPLNFKLQPGMKLELDKDAKVDFLESKVPNSTYFEHANNLIREIFASLKLPYTFYDQRGASYSATRADMNRYQYSVINEREMFYESLDQMYDHVIKNAIFNDELILPSGMTVDDIDWNYIPRSNFILDASRETQVVIDKIKAGLMSPQQGILELGISDDYEDVVDQIAYAQALMREKGIVIEMAAPGATVNQVDQSNVVE